jgi:hypothetical protein
VRNYIPCCEEDRRNLGCRSVPALRLTTKCKEKKRSIPLNIYNGYPSQYIVITCQIPIILAVVRCPGMFVIV